MNQEPLMRKVVSGCKCCNEWGQGDRAKDKARAAQQIKDETQVPLWEEGDFTNG